MNIKSKIAVLVLGANHHDRRGAGGTSRGGESQVQGSGNDRRPSECCGRTDRQRSADGGIAVPGYYLDQMNTTCQGQVAHAAAVKAMVRPKKYPKATWNILMQGVDAYAKGAAECVTTTQYGVDHAGTGPAANAVVDSGLKQVDTDWSTGNTLVNQAAYVLIKAKIH